ncbi:DUF4430 domain-containing protein [Streptomyces celluloflavus]|uniref:DUF4430 domain-containing protein n=1 Tax=Streptomyces celluloflavus TaxID=58344 RepID=UPI003664B995
MFGNLRHRILVTAAALGLALTAWAPAATAQAAPAAAAPVTVHLTVTGPGSVLYNADLKTTGHTVTTASGGTHICDGTNNGANPSPGATPTAALDDAAHAAGFTWDGTWYASFNDYLVASIAGHAGGSEAYWNIAVNGVATPVGGCQFRIADGDSVAFTWTEL